MMEFNELNDRLARLVQSFVQPRVVGVVIVVAVIMVMLTAIPVIGQLIGLIVFGFLAYWLWTRWIRNA